nr:hypothetical protein [Gammaproteobacteria bacterium]
LLPGKTELTQDFYVGTENGNVLESLNAGHTWKSLTQPDGSIVYDIISIRTSASDGTLVAAMGSGKVAISLDRGNNWIFTDEKPDGSPVYGVSLDPKNTRTSDCETTIINSNACNLYVATANGNVLRTTNGGKTWTSSQPMPGIAVFDVSASTNGTVYAGLENGKTKVSFDSGQSWGLEGSPNSSAVNGLLALHHAHSYAATNSGRIMYSTNFGKNWTALPEAPDTSSSSSRSTPALAKIYSPSLKITSIANVKDGE